jgi:hypothetical protein
MRPGDALDRPPAVPSTAIGAICAALESDRSFTTPTGSAANAFQACRKFQLSAALIASTAFGFW